jgi:hypothetical protein
MTALWTRHIVTLEPSRNPQLKQAQVLVADGMNRYRRDVGAGCNGSAA